MVCEKCGTDIGDSKFCSNCGAPAPKAATVCKKCGTDVQGVKFCPNCGTPVGSSGNDTEESVGSKLKEIFEKMTGGKSEDIKFGIADLGKDVFKPHTKEEGEDLLICGTSKTTPELGDIMSNWRRPWLYFRVFCVLALTFILLLVCAQLFDNILVYPGMLFIGALMMPFSLLVLIWEANMPRNISMYQLIVMFSVGGMASFVCALSMFSFVDAGNMGVLDAIVIGVVEEVGKLIIVAVLIHMYKCKYLLNGLLVGAAVGAGFAVFESAGYAYTAADPVMSILLRGVLSAGGHLVWAAMSGAAIMLAKGAKPMSMKVFSSLSFWMLFPVPVILHALWDMPYPVPANLVVVSFLVVIAWVFILALIRAGMAEVSRLCAKEAKKTDETEIQTI